MERDELMEEEASYANELDEEFPGDGDGWREYVGRHKTYEFMGQYGLQGDNIPATITPLEVFDLFVDNDVYDLIVQETNRFTEQLKIDKQNQKYARIHRWFPTNREEIKRFLILTVWMGLVPIGNVKDYWATNSTVYNFEYPKSIMPRNRYQLLLSVIHFNDNRTIQRDNRLGKIEKLLALLQTKFQTIYTPDENIVIDESLVPWRGRLIFRHIPTKHTNMVLSSSNCAQTMVILGELRFMLEKPLME